MPEGDEVPEAAKGKSNRLDSKGRRRSGVLKGKRKFYGVEGEVPRPGGLSLLSVASR